MKGNTARVSIVIPTFNRDTVLPRAIDSVIAQTFPEWELIVVDDGSTDNTRDVVETYMSRDTRIHYVYQENQRQAAARNNGIRNASGEMIAFLDSDDEWMPGKLERQVTVLEGEPDCGMVYSNQLMVADEGDSGEFRYPLGQLRSGYVFSDLLRRQFYCSTQTALVRRSVLDHVGLFDEQFANALEDWELTLRIAYHYKVTCIDEPLIRRFVNHNSSRDYALIRARNHRAILEKTFAHCSVPSKERRLLWKSAWFTWGVSFLQEGYYFKSVACFAHAMFRRHRFAMPALLLGLAGPLGRCVYNSVQELGKARST